MTATEDDADSDSLLEGKTVMFPHNTQTEKMVGFRLFLFVVVSAVTLAPAQLTSRVDQIKERYQRDRARGLKMLTERYLAQYEAEMNRVLAAQDLEEANKIKAKIDQLRKEVEESSAIQSGDTDAVGESLLVGKTVFFKHDRYPDHDSSYIFKEDGKAIWAGAGKESVPRQYKATGKPRQFLLWWPGHDLQPAWEITVAADGVTATLRNTNNDYTAEGRIERTR